MASDSLVFIALIVLVFSLLFSSGASGTSYYVSLHGNDSNTGTSQGQAFYSIQKAINVAQSGDIIHLDPGNYYQDFSSIRDGKPGNPIIIEGPSDAIIRGAGADHPVEINNSYLTLEGFTVNGLYGNPNSVDGYRQKLVYVQGTGNRSGVTHLRIVNMTIENSQGEGLRLRYFAQDNEVVGTTIRNTGIADFVFNESGKNGEGIYLGTSSNQWSDGKNPTADPDHSDNNWIHNNVIETNGNECVDVKEGSDNNLIENNSCTGQLDPKSGGIDLRGNNNTVRYNVIHGNVGSGVRIGGHIVGGVQYGVENTVYMNTFYNNKGGDVEVVIIPQSAICGNSENGSLLTSTGDYGSDFNISSPCGFILSSEPRAQPPAETCTSFTCGPYFIYLASGLGVALFAVVLFFIYRYLRKQL